MGAVYSLRDLEYVHGLDLNYTDPARHLTTVGWDRSDLPDLLNYLICLICLMCVKRV